MQLREIRQRILLAKENLKKINPRIKCYMVVSINGIQFNPGELTASNTKLVDLVKYPEIFLPGQEIERLVQCAERIGKLKDGKHGRPEDEGLMRGLMEDFMAMIEKCEFHEPQCELRFDSLDMEKIQELKAHPIVKEIGKTDMSAASINVVIG